MNLSGKYCIRTTMNRTNLLSQIIYIYINIISSCSIRLSMLSNGIYFYRTGCQTVHISIRNISIVGYIQYKIWELRLTLLIVIMLLLISWLQLFYNDVFFQFKRVYGGFISYLFPLMHIFVKQSTTLQWNYAEGAVISNLKLSTIRGPFKFIVWIR